MRLVVIALAIASVVSLVGTPLLIKLLARRGYAQAIRVSSEGETYPDHEAKRGTPSMGGAAILLAVVIGYFGTHLITWRPVTISGLLVLFLMVGLGLVGLADDYLKIFKQRSTGLRARTNSSDKRWSPLPSPISQCNSLIKTDRQRRRWRYLSCETPRSCCPSVCS